MSIFCVSDYPVYASYWKYGNIGTLPLFSHQIKPEIWDMSIILPTFPFLMYDFRFTIYDF
uniref:Uncharacterized protein n=1 Tax=Kuenenia stuttgartiensis TaxID=174633 RepID=Q1Q6I2_KUEST|nr:unknown protein [Candidatus Kuenenia stuttgartiensis]